MSVRREKAKKQILLGVLLLILAASLYWRNNPDPIVSDFFECVEAGNPVMESYPRQCRDEDGNGFVEDIGNELEKDDLIRISAPRPNATVESPIEISGMARGTWFFEGDFPVVLADWDGKIIGEGYATAQGDWMVEEFVPFSGTITFDIAEIQGDYSNRGTLILKKDNPSDLPLDDDALEIPVLFK